MKFSKLEIRDIVKAWFTVSLMFAIALTGLKQELLVALLFALVTAGIGFVLHELAHKFVAQKYKCQAEFRANNRMLLVGLIISFTGFILAAPGGVFVQGANKSQHGKIAFAGPLMNILLAILFLVLTKTTTGLLANVMLYGWLINSWLAAFNLIPVIPFDGRAVWLWNKIVYVIAVIVSLGLVGFSMG
ncbi:hypothetical protein COV18_04615 [Candidatus Woesearchaeota archaeon CG10_big_fil_rev_8_21_14_0_10_37_12]|nr:MAG: hypothetical protein COV18_04615 [Candidatus Woesearchaeota archaeon CG10_big_fil_rev_8_21_14_0_10_37_12]